MATTPQDWTAQLPPSQPSGSIPSGNPLAKHFRTPAISISLPSNGKFWEMGSIETSPTGEHQVFPMTARDEMNFNTPDALLNGQGVVDVIHSCIPSIKNAWKMPSIDVDRVLIAIRIASYGETMDFDSKCPQCGEENRFEMDLRTFMDKSIDIGIFDDELEYNGLRFNFKPQDYEVINNLNMENFEYQRLIAAINDSDTDDAEKNKRVNEIFQKITARTVNTLARAIASITTSDGQIVDKIDFIEEFLTNCDRKTFKFIETAVTKYADSLNLDDVKITCTNNDCGHDYAIPFTFDNANFFGSDS